MAPRAGKSGGVNKTPRRMKTRARARDAEALKRRLKDLHAQSNENIAKRKALESRIGEVEQRLQNPEITNQAENEAQLKALFTELNQLTEKEEAIQAQIKAADEEQHGSEMDVDDVDHGLGSDPPDFAQTREVDVPVEDDDENDTPGDYADIKPVDTVDLTGDGEPEGWGLDGGTTLAKHKASRGPIYLNSYGYKSCAMTVWESAQAERTVGKVTSIRGNPHKKALETNEEGEYIHRGKIKKILNVAWKPKRKIRNIEDLLDSVEELNPQNKVDEAKYRYPFSTVLVEWTDGLVRTWISRTDYKTLSSQSKASNERTDRKFYQIGLLQVKRYREIMLGGSNQGDLERTPPGLTESPEPGEGDPASHQANNDIPGRGAKNEGGRASPGDPRRPGSGSQNAGSQNAGSQNSGSQNSGSQNSGSQNSGSQNSGSQNSGSQGQASQHQDNKKHGDQNRGDQTQESSNHGNNPRTMRSFYAEWLRENDLDANTEVSTLGDQLFGRFTAAAHAYADEYERRFGQQLQDDMGFIPAGALLKAWI
ncbi:hypothetical protein ASPCAL10229 [Aspergillus calidoustus]|uniref:Uncharacterized protein n=1 Tax=Aspergillus calidoustus TaxID=454130 RepID=A0A0U5G9K5_ASPCI|nr:hypothetical protein ASPCAL10229 [Aspergillus calidoustus]